MKRAVLGILLVVFSLVWAGSAESWFWDRKEETAPAATLQAPAVPQAPAVTPQKAQPPAAAPLAVEAPAPVKPAPPVQKPKPLSPEVQKKKALLEKKRNALNNNQWDIEVLPLSGKGQVEKDVIVFEDKRFRSEVYAKQGYKPSNFTLSLQDGTTVVFETMQVDDNQNIIFWRGECSMNLLDCSGIISRQIAGGQSKDYSFKSVAKKPVLR